MAKIRIGIRGDIMDVYLDTAASTPLLQSVKDKLLSILDIYANPSSLHTRGQQASSIIEEAKQGISSKLNCNPEEIYFTSGATMSNNQAILGFIKRHPGCAMVTSCIEHDDIYLMIQDYSYNLKHLIPCDTNGFLDLDSLKECLDELQSKERTILLSIQWANNETGVIQDMEAICDIVNSYPDVYIHTDATQYIPYYPIDLSFIKVDMLSCSAQKIGGLKGTGLLYVRNNVKLSPIIYGDQGLIGGTENVPGIACIGEAVKSISYSNEKLIENRNYLYHKLRNYGTLVGSLDNRLPNNLNMIFSDVRGEELQAFMSDFGVYVSTGSACSSHTDKPSRTLTAMGYSADQANSSIRFSLGKDITKEELDYVAIVTTNGIDALRQK